MKTINNLTRMFLSLSVTLILTISCEDDFSAQIPYNPPVLSEDGIAVGTMEEVGMDTQMMASCLAAIYNNKYDQVHSILVYKDDKLVFEEYMEGNKYDWGGQYYYGERIKWNRETFHMIMSCTKSVTSAIVGIAVEQGYIDVSSSIFDYLPEYREYKTGGKEDITVEHLLTMTSGLEWDEWSGAHGTTANDIDVIYIECQDDPLSCILSKPLVREPGESFTYSGGNMIILGEVVKNATGMNIMEYGTRFLFEPLGIDSVYWYHFDNGAYACDGSIAMTPRDMLKIGITFLNEGSYNGHQVISKDWVERSRTAYGNNTGIRVPIDDTGRNGYGYTWWTNSLMAPEGKVDIYQASGWGGQEIIVVPDLNMTVVFTGGNYVVKKHIHEIMEKYILAGME